MPEGAGLFEELEQKLPELAGAIITSLISLAQALKAVNSELRNPTTAEWKQVETIYRILL